jgi:hypothetical protein
VVMAVTLTLEGCPVAISVDDGTSLVFLSVGHHSHSVGFCGCWWWVKSLHSSYL